MAATAVASRKRGPAAFLDDDPFALPFPVDLPRPPKRGRCSPSAAAADLGLSFPLECDPVDALQLIFPGADPQDLQDHLAASGNVLDAAIRTYKDYLALRSTQSSSPVTCSPSFNKANDDISPEVDVPLVSIPTNGSEWAELVVKEMSSASDLVDAKNRAFRILKLLEKSTTDPYERQKVHKEHKIVKQMLGALLHQNGVLKRAFLIQHNRLKEYQEMVQERSLYNQIVEKYQKQIKALEDRNNVLSFHLQQANKHSNIYSHRNPDIF